MGKLSCVMGTALALFCAGTPSRAQSGAIIAGLDHINIAVVDLDAAAARYRDLGFSLKHGAPHGNGIKNQHVKFPDGTELELITAPSAADALTATYRRYLAQGDAPAFAAFFVRQPDSIASKLRELNFDHRPNGRFVSVTSPELLTYVFFGPRNHSPTDRPEHFAHANTATSLVGVWLAGDDLSAERRLLQSSGALLAEEEVHTPQVSRVTVARVPDGEILFLPGVRQVLPGRKIVGATVAVQSLAVARRVIATGLGQSLPIVHDAKGSRVFVPPSLAHGLWLELRESP